MSQDDGADDPASPHGSPARALTAVAVVAVVVWSAYLLVWEPAPFTLTFDDAWYYLGIARNLAHGHGSSFDGINATNGYHPLWLLVAAAAFALGLDGTGAARVLLVVQVVVGLGGTLAVVVALLTRLVDGWPTIRRPDPARTADARRWANVVVAATLAVLVANPFVVKTVVNGLESALVVPLQLLAVLLVIRRAIPAGGTGRHRPSGAVLAGASHRWRLGLSAVLALAFLARTDTVLLFATFGVWCVAELVTRRSDGGAGPFVVLAELFALPAVTMAAYLASNQVWFGTPIQISGLVKRAPLTVTSVGGFAVVVALAAWLGARGFRASHGPAPKTARRFPLLGRFAAASGWYGAFCVVLVGYYALLQTQIWLWYFAPVVAYGLVLLLLAVADVTTATLAGAPADRPAAQVVRPVLAVFLIPLLVLLAYEGRSFLDPDLRSIQEANRDAGRWIAANLPTDAVLASWDAGVVGYFADRPVVNLDGVVNSKAFHDAAQAGTVGSFLACQGVGYTVNHGPIASGRSGDEDPTIRPFLRATFGDAVADSAVVVERLPFHYSGTTTGSAGTDSTGDQDLAVFVYRLDPAAMDAARAAAGC